jgi:predicted anti-sigma-YlaC factor YlaD
MTCDAIRELLPDVLTGSPASEVDAHLAGCAACRAEADLLRALLDRLRDAVTPDAEPVAPPSLEAVLAAARAREVTPARRAPRLLQAAALLLAAGLGALADRALTAVPPTAPLPPPPVVASGPELDASLREVVAAQPGGLAASLALLGALSDSNTMKR